MSVVSQTFDTTPGTRSFFHPSITFAQILGVKRDGIGQTEVSTSPGNREFRYTGLNIQVSTSQRFNTGEKIWILYEV